MKFTLQSLLVATLGLTVSLQPLRAEEPAAMVDKCVAVKASFEKERREAMDLLRSAIEEWRNLSDEDVVEYWLEGSRSELRKVFEEEVLPQKRRDIELSGGVVNSDLLFDSWLQNDVLGEPETRRAIIAEFRSTLEEGLEQERRHAIKTFDEVERRLKDDCSMAFEDQALRVAVAGLTAPYESVVGNLESAKDESGLGAQAVRAALGISVGDMVKHGPEGGPNSEARRASQAGEAAVKAVEKVIREALKDGPLGTGSTLLPKTDKGIKREVKRIERELKRLTPKVEVRFP